MAEETREIYGKVRWIPMFSEREMSKAIDWLFELFSPEDYEGYDEDEIGYAGGLCLREVCTALRGEEQKVY